MPLRAALPEQSFECGDRFDLFCHHFAHAKAYMVMGGAWGAGGAAILINDPAAPPPCLPGI